MSIAQTLLAEFEHEMANTRRALERIPNDKLQYKPHPKSMSLAALADHLAGFGDWAATTIQTPELDLGAFQPPVPPDSIEKILATFDANTAKAKAALSSVPDDALMVTWTLKMGDKVFFSMPRIQVLRGMILNHLYHHRGQLTVYLRMLDVPVPALYGPSADEGQMGGS